MLDRLASARVLVLLPPSEGKTAPGRGAPLDLAKLSFPELTERRSALLDALVDADLEALGLSPGQADELERNRTLRTAPAAAAGKVYTGVLYERLRLPELPPPARRRVLIASGLWGFVAPGDRIPAYRLPISGRLQGFPGLAAWWRPALEAAVPASGLVLDLRSGGYAAAFRPRGVPLLQVRGFTADGKVISHMVKAIRGDVARIALSAKPVPRSAAAVAELVSAAGYRAELTATTLNVYLS
jgi:cytoplasmic iron level regulating protein YaaA (DUF328/UPF0246 family)